MTVRGTAEQAVHHSELLTGRHLIQTPFRWLLNPLRMQRRLIAGLAVMGSINPDINVP